MSERREWNLNRAAWAPNGRLVAYEPEMYPPADQQSIPVVELKPGEIVISRDDLLEAIDRAQSEKIHGVPRFMLLADELFGEAKDE